MVKVKIFKSGYIDDLEVSINNWLEKNTDKKIIDIKQSSAYDETHTVTYNVVSIFYKNKVYRQDLGPR